MHLSANSRITFFQFNVNLIKNTQQNHFCFLKSLTIILVLLLHGYPCWSASFSGAALEICTGRFFSPEPGPCRWKNHFSFAGPARWKNHLSIAGPARWKDRLSFADPARACWKNRLTFAGPASWKNHGPGWVPASRQTRARADLYHDFLWDPVQEKLKL